MLNDNNLFREYLRYILPSIASQVVFTTYVLVDGIFVARGVGENALAAVNIASPYVTSLWALSMIFAIGTSTVVARLKGEGNLRQASSVFTQNMTAMAIISIIFALTVLMMTDKFCIWLGATEQTHDYALTYIRTVAPFTATFLFSYTLEILMATDGHPFKATMTVSLGVVINCILDYVFIFIFHQGVFGAAIATAISQSVVIVLYIIHFVSDKAEIRLCAVKWQRGQVLSCIIKGLPSGISELSPGLITFIYVHQINKYFGSAELLGYSATAYVAQILMILAIGIAQGTQPLLSFYNGADRADKISKLLRYQIVTSLILELLTVAILLKESDKILSVFITNDANLISNVEILFKIFIISCVPAAFNIIIASYFTSLEKPVPGTMISLGRCSYMLVLAICIMMAFNVSDWLWWAMSLGEVLTLVMAIILYLLHQQRIINK